MAKDVPSLSDGPGWLPFDLLGQPVPANKGCKGRPQHAPTAENLEKLILLYAAGKTDAECAASVGATIPTMKRHYFASAELRKVRQNAAVVVEGEMLSRLNAQSKAGNTSATEKLMKRIDKARLGPVLVAPPKKKKLGKKEQRSAEAKYAGAGTEEWGGLLNGEAGPHPGH